MQKTLIVSSLSDGITLRFASYSDVITVELEKFDLPSCQLNIHRTDAFIAERAELNGLESLSPVNRTRLAVFTGQLSKIVMTLGAYEFSTDDQVNAMDWLHTTLCRWSGDIAVYFSDVIDNLTRQDEDFGHTAADSVIASLGNEGDSQ